MRGKSPNSNSAFWLAVCLMVCVCSTDLPAQETGDQRSDAQAETVRQKADEAVHMQPLRPADPFRPVRRALPSNPVELSNLTLAKMDANAEEPRLILLVEQFRMEEGEIEFTEMRMEKRTQVYNVTENGKQVRKEREVTVMVPITGKRKGQVRVSAGKKPTTVPFDELKVYRLDGTRVTAEQSAELLATLKPVFLVDGLNRKIEPANDIIRQALRPDMLIVVTAAPPP